MLAAHDAADAMRLRLVGDDDHRGLERVGLAVQRLEGLAIPGPAHGEVAGKLVGVEDVQWTRDVEGGEVGDVDQGGDRAKADGGQAVLQPARARAVLDAADQATDHHGAAELGAGRDLPLDRALEPALGRRCVERLQRADAGSGEVAGDAADAETVGAVRRDRDLDDRIVQAHHLGEGLSDRRIGRKVDDAFMVVGEAHLVGRAQHTVGGLAADDAGLQLGARPRDHRAGGGEDALHAGPRVRRAADHLDLAIAGVDQADAKPVGVRMLLGLDHVADDEGGKPLGAVVDAFDLEADAGEGIGDVQDPGTGFQVLLQPGKGDLHRLSPPARLGASTGTKP